MNGLRRLILVAAWGGIWAMDVGLLVAPNPPTTDHDLLVMAIFLAAMGSVVAEVVYWYKRADRRGFGGVFILASVAVVALMYAAQWGWL